MNTTFVYAKILESIQPLDRGTKYEDPLEAFLQSEQLGSITGGGTMQDKSGKIHYVGIDIDVFDLGSLPRIAEKLHQLGAPAGSTLEFKVNGTRRLLPIAKPEL